MKTLSNLIFNNLKISDFSKIAIKCPTTNSWKWIENRFVNGSIETCRTRLKQLNIKPGERVVYKGNNSLEWITWNLACNSLGIIWVPMYTNQPYQYTEHVIKDCKPSLVISDDNNIFKIHGELRQISNDITHSTVYEGDTDFRTNDKDIANIIYTSGTTGSPKGVVLTNNNIISNLEAVRTRFPTVNNVTSLNILPWAHIYSQTCELYYNLIYDNKLAISSGKDKFLHECREIKPDVLYVVPKLLEMVKQKIEVLDKPVIQLVLPHILKHIFGANVQFIFTGGAKLKDNVKQFFSENGIVICEGYGCSETAPMISVNHFEDPRDINSIGKILDNVLVDIVDGEIQVAGPNVMMGYWEDKSKTDEVLVKRDDKIWYKTGDSGEIKDGFLYYNGRLSDNYKLSNGKFVNVQEVEGVISEFVQAPFIVYGEQDAHNAIITTENIHQPTLDLINDRLEKQLHIKSVSVIDEETMSNFYTPKMSIKRKKLIEHVSNIIA